MSGNKTINEVHVVMGNDYPDSVFSTAEAAEKYCAERRAADKKRNNLEGKRFYPTVYWRVYSFPVRDGVNGA